MAISSKKCRHCQVSWDTEWEYCPECQHNYAGAKYPAVVTEKELEERERIVSEIRKAFEVVRLDGGMTIHEADLEGSYSNFSARLAAREKDPEQYWWEIPDWKLEELNSALWFLDEKGYRFLLPAGMIWCLRKGKKSRSMGLDSVTNSLVPDALVSRASVFSTLTREQLRSVWSFLKHVEKYYPHTNAQNALRDYWQGFGD
jgi:hypothetical protein